MFFSFPPQVDDFYPLFKAAKDSKNTGGIHDFVEILKLYDKNEDNTILGKGLFRLLTNLGKQNKNKETGFESKQITRNLVYFRREADQGRVQEPHEGAVRTRGRWGLHALHA